MTLNEAEVDIIKSKITGRLAATEYASTLSLVPGGTTNLVFRGRLKRRFAEPGETPVESVVVKHVLSFARLNKSLPLDTTRAVGILQRRRN